MKKLRFITILFLGIIVTVSSCKKEAIEELEGNIILTSSTEYPLGIVSRWTNVSDIDSYKLYRSDDGENYEKLITLGKNDVQYFDTSVVTEIQYHYYISGVSDDIDGSIQSNTSIGRSVNLTTENSFSLLSDLTGGYYTTTPSADSLTDIIIALIDSIATEGADVMFLIDKTGSMMDDIFAVQSGLTSIIAALPSNCRLGLASYGDLVADSVWVGSINDWYDFEDLTLNHSNIQALVNNLSTEKTSRSILPGSISLLGISERHRTSGSPEDRTPILHFLAMASQKYASSPGSRCGDCRIFASAIALPVAQRLTNC